MSPATASRVLTGSARVRPETRQQVEAAIAHLGYVRNRAPRASSSRGTGSIAFMVCEDNARVFSEPFFPLMLSSVSRELSARGIQLVLLTAHSPRDYQIASRYLRSGHVDGALLVSMHGKRPLDLRSLGVPGGAGRPLVRQRRGHLLRRRGQRRRGQDGGASTCSRTAGTWSPPSRGRPTWRPGPTGSAGYRAAMAEAGLTDPSLIVFGDFGRVSAEHGLYRLLDRRPGSTPCSPPPT